jgi:hypothetical protein
LREPGLEVANATMEIERNDHSLAAMNISESSFRAGVRESSNTLSPMLAVSFSLTPRLGISQRKDSLLLQ